MLRRKVLVTGAGGFIGSHIVEELAPAGFDVKAFVHYNSDGSWGNLEKISADVLNSVEVIADDILIHLRWIGLLLGVNWCSISQH